MGPNINLTSISKTLRIEIWIWKPIQKDFWLLFVYLENYSIFIFITTNAGWNENCREEKQQIGCGSERHRTFSHFHSFMGQINFLMKNLCRSIQSIPTTKRATKKSSFLKIFRMQRLSACGNINNDQKIYVRTCESL